MFVTNTIKKQICLLNNDTLVTHNWYVQLSTALESADDIGVVSPVTNACSNNQQIDVPYDPYDWIAMQDFAQWYNASDPSKWEQRFRAIGFCLLFNRSLTLQIGGLDARFFPGNFEDDDFTLRVQHAGYRILVCRDTFIHHRGSSSFNTKPGQLRRALDINARRFKEKWGFVSWEVQGCRTNLMIHNELDLFCGKARVLDIGCGYGATIQSLRARYPEYQYFGIEANCHLAGVAINHTPGIICSSIKEARLPYPKGFFDCVILSAWPQDNPVLTLKEIKRLVKPGGILIGEVHHALHWPRISRVFTQQRCPMPLRGTMDSEPIYALDGNQLQEVLETSGWTQKAQKRILDPKLNRVAETEIKTVLDAAGILVTPAKLECYRTVSIVFTAVKRDDDANISQKVNVVSDS